MEISKYTDCQMSEKQDKQIPVQSNNLFYTVEVSNTINL